MTDVRTILGAALDDVPLVVLVKDASGRLLAANRRAAEVFGYPLEELLAKTEPELTPRPEERIAEVTTHLVAEGELRGRVPIKRADGRVLELDYVAYQASLDGTPVFVSLASPAPSAVVSLMLGSVEEGAR